MRIRRFFWFSVILLAGLAVGLITGWVIIPAGVEEASTASLRVDYKTDLVLMVAETYSGEGDLAAALQRLSEIENVTPLRQVQQAILNAQQMGYARSDIETLAYLFQDLQTPTPTPQETQP